MGSRRLLAGCLGVLLSVMPAPAVVVDGRNDIVVREVFRCRDEGGHARAFTYHLNRWDYGYQLWAISTSFDFRDLSIFGRKMPPQKMDLAIIVIYDTREDGSPERLDVVEARAREILSGARTHIAYDGKIHWGPYTIVQDLENQRFEIDHRQPYQGGSEGRVQITIGPSGAPHNDVAGFVRSHRMNLIDDNGRLTSCSFNRTALGKLNLR